MTGGFRPEADGERNHHMIIAEFGSPTVIEAVKLLILRCCSGWRSYCFNRFSKLVRFS